MVAVVLTIYMAFTFFRQVEITFLVSIQLLLLLVPLPLAVILYVVHEHNICTAILI